MDDIKMDESFRKELPEDDPNAMYNRKKAVELAPVQKLNKHQLRKERRKNLDKIQKTRSSLKKEKRLENRKKMLEKYNRRDEILEKVSQSEISKEAESLLIPTSSLGIRTSKRQKYREALKRRELGLPYDQSIIENVEKRLELSKTSNVEDNDNDSDSDSDDSDNGNDEIFQTNERAVGEPKQFLPLIKPPVQPAPEEPKQEEPIPEKPSEPRPAINVKLDRPEGVEEIRSKLPIYTEEQNIVEAIHENDVIIVCGETGSGKTTQIPQFLYEAGYGTLRTHGKIAITEPRRVAAINMSKRVAYEMGLPWGQKVGYQIRNNKFYTESTIIKFCTDGILLREAEEDLLLSKYSVIIIDEAHERTINTDVLIGLLSKVVNYRKRKILEGNTNVEPLKFIIMSATLRVDDFLNENLFEHKPLILEIKARQYPISEHYSPRTPEPSERMEAVKHCVEMIHETKPSGGILVFLPGKNEINECVQYFRSNYPRFPNPESSKKSKSKNEKESEKKESEKSVEEEKQDEPAEEEKSDKHVDKEDSDVPVEDEDIFGIMDFKHKVKIHDKKPMNALPLYSLLPQEEQDKVFQEQGKDVRLVVFSTNIAETSITIPNIKYVVDLGLEKCREFDQLNGIIRSRVDYISKASAEQRKGRAGRTGPGECFHLYTRGFLINTFKDFTPPEIQRKPITEIVLLLKTMGLNDISKFPFPTLISEENLQKAETTLKNIGLIELESPYGATTLGKLVSQFPLEPRLGKLIVSSKIVGLVEYAIILAAGLDVREPFDYGKLDKGFVSKLGDPFTLLNVFGEYSCEKDKAKFCVDNHISQKAMEEIQSIRQQITTIIWKYDKKCLQSDIAGEVKCKDVESNLAPCLFSAYCDHVAKYNGKDNYYTTCDNIKAEIRRSSCLYDKKTAYITYINVESNAETGTMLFNNVCRISPHWIMQICWKLLNVKSISPPRYSPQKDAVVGTAEATFGQPNWKLPLSEVNHPEPYKAFAAALLRGDVIPQFKQFQSKLATNPNDLEIANKSVHPRLMMIVAELKRKEISSKRKLEQTWNTEPLFLLSPCLMWYPDKSVQSKLTQNWPFKSTEPDKKIEFSDYDSYSDSD